MNGLGDLIWLITRWTGIEYLTHRFTKLTGFECGCMRRRQRWNEMFPFKSQ